MRSPKVCPTLDITEPMNEPGADHVERLSRDLILTAIALVDGRLHVLLLVKELRTN